MPERGLIKRHSKRLAFILAATSDGSRDYRQAKFLLSNLAKMPSYMDFDSKQDIQLSSA